MSALIEIGRPSSSRIWLSALRPATLLAGVVPVIVGSAMAARDGHFALLPAVAALVGALFLQIGCNFANDLFDFLKGADDDSRLGPARMTQQGLVTTRQMALATGIAFGLALLVGIYLVSVAGWPVVAIGLAGIFAGIFYTAGPRPLGYLGLGEVLVFIFFGLAAVGGTYYVQAHSVSFDVIVVATSIGMLSSAILVVNNLRDRDTDGKVGKNTLAVRFGARFSRYEYVVLVSGAFAGPAYLATSPDGSWHLLTFLAAPWAIAAMGDVFRRDGRELNPLLGRTARIEALFGVLLAAAVLL